MSNLDLKVSLVAKLRLASQQVIKPTEKSAAAVVRSLGAMQAQDYENALWAIGCRMKDGTRNVVEEAISNREIVRCWPMRRTIHFVPAEDARWMVAVSAEKTIGASLTRAKQLELDEKIFAKTRKVISKALEKASGPVSRDALREELIAAKLPAHDSRSTHLFWRVAQEGLICFGPREGKQQTFVLAADWVKNPRTPERDEAIRILVQRYFASHGPATIKDFTWWSGLKVSETKAALEDLGDAMLKVRVGGVDHWMSPDIPVKDLSCGMQLLPAFDEIVISYHDRTMTLAKEHSNRIVPGGNGMFLPMLMDGARVIGTWKRTATTRQVKVAVELFEPEGKSKAATIGKAAAVYAKFLGLPITCEIR